MVDPVPDSLPFEAALSEVPVRPDPGSREALTLLHTGAFAIGAAWMYGGNVPWAGALLTAWGALGALLTLSGTASHQLRAAVGREWLWLLPLIAFDVFVGLSLFNPNYRRVIGANGPGFIELQTLRWPGMPSTARPEVSLAALAFFNGAYLSAFNLVLWVRRRRALRVLWLALVANAAILAVFGTVQQLSGAKAPFFSTAATHQPYFFASFIYHNHWGAFALLSAAGALAVAGHHLWPSRPRPAVRTPAPAALVALLFLAVAIPLSASRSASLLLAGLLLLGGLNAAARWVRRGPHRRLLPAAFATAVLLAGGLYVYHIGGPVIDRRFAETRGMLTEMQRQGEYLPRRTLYHDTWALARERWLFGWGMGSFPTAFYTRNTQHHSPVDGLPHYFEDAHSDWLQAVAELGVAGTALLLACAVVPWLGRRHSALALPFPRFLLIGCALLVLYAALEFPFGNRAVVILFWIAWFSALQYARLERWRGRPSRCFPS
jgi:O-antigen ligase